MSELKKYTEAVATRKSIDRKVGMKVNLAVLLEIEDKDVPRLLEIIRVQDEALQEIAKEIAGEPESQSESLIAIMKVQELAACGSKAKFGEYEPHNGGSHAGS